MPTTKKRINITLDPETERVINVLAKRKKQSKSAIVASLTREALELQEDIALAKIAEERMKCHDGRWLKHEEVWGK